MSVANVHSTNDSKVTVYHSQPSTTSKLLSLKQEPSLPEVCSRQHVKLHAIFSADIVPFVFAGDSIPQWQFYRASEQQERQQQ